MKRLFRTLLVVSGLLALAACENKSSGGAPPVASATATPSAATSASAVPAASAAASGSASANPVGASAGSWSGNYKSAALPLSLPTGKGYEDVKWQGDDSGVGLGDGALSIAVDGATGVVAGTADGALGNIVLDGVVVDGQMTASITRKDPADRGLTGTAIGKVVGDKIEGTMNLSLPEANVIRKATFTLTKKS